MPKLPRMWWGPPETHISMGCGVRGISIALGVPIQEVFEKLLDCKLGLIENLDQIFESHDGLSIEQVKKVITGFGYKTKFKDFKQRRHNKFWELKNRTLIVTVLRDFKEDISYIRDEVVDEANIARQINHYLRRALPYPKTGSEFLTGHTYIWDPKESVLFNSTYTPYTNFGRRDKYGSWFRNRLDVECCSYWGFEILED